VRSIGSLSKLLGSCSVPVQCEAEEAFTELYESDDAQALVAPPSADELLVLVDRVIRFAQSGIDGGR
jgi:hypothetical protein